MPGDVAGEVERWRRELRRGTTRLAVLAVLSQEENYGYGILRTLRAREEGPWSTTEATVYPLLHDLEEGGYLTSSWRTTEAGVPPRRVYALTPSGRELLQELREAWRASRDALDDLLRGDT